MDFAFTAEAGLAGLFLASFLAATLLPQHLAPQKSALARRRGPPILLLAWAPIIGDALCAAAGWLRLPPLQCALWMTIGKGALLRRGLACLIRHRRAVQVRAGEYRVARAARSSVSLILQDSCYRSLRLSNPNGRSTT